MTVYYSMCQGVSRELRNMGGFLTAYKRLCADLSALASTLHFYYMGPRRSSTGEPATTTRLGAEMTNDGDGSAACGEGEREEAVALETLRLLDAPGEAGLARADSSEFWLGRADADAGLGSNDARGGLGLSRQLSALDGRALQWQI